MDSKIAFLVISLNTIRTISIPDKEFSFSNISIRCHAMTSPSLS